ncbi:MAG: hypothetical protein ACRCVN_00400 [Spirochaetia bacterium]
MKKRLRPINLTTALSCAFPLLILLSCAPKTPPRFEIAVASEMSATPFFILASISKKITWSVRVIEDEETRIELLKDGEVQAIEYDVVGLYKHNISDENSPLVGILPINTSYNLVGQPGMTTLALSRKEAIVGVDYQEVRSFLLYHWLQGAARNEEMLATDDLRRKRLLEESLSAIIVGEPTISQLIQEGYPVLSSTHMTGLGVGTLACFRNVDPQLIKNALLDYQQMLNQFEFIKKSPERFLMKSVPNFKPEWLFYLPQSIYFSPQLFEEVDTWIRLNNPTISPIPYHRMFWTTKE